MDNINKEIDELKDLLKDSKSQVSKMINQLPSDQKKILGNVIKDMNNAFKKKDLNLLNDVFNKATKLAENESKLSK